MTYRVDTTNIPIDEIIAEILALNGSGVTRLDLSNNGLCFKSSAELAAMLTALEDSGVTHLNLSGNDLGIKTDAEFKTIFEAIPKRISVGLSYDELNNMKPEQRKVIQEIFPNGKNLIIINPDNSVMAPARSVAGANAYMKLGFSVNVTPPSLLTLCTFFTEKKRLDTSALHEYDTGIKKLAASYTGGGW